MTLTDEDIERLASAVVEKLLGVRLEQLVLRRSVGVSLMEQIASIYGVTLQDLQGPSRERHICWPRQVVMWALHEFKPGLSYPQIGRLLRRDHTTVIHGVRRVQKVLQAGGGDGFLAAVSDLLVAPD